MSTLSTQPKLRLTIGTKLVGLIAVLLLSSVIGLVWVSTRMFAEDNTGLIQQMNLDTAGGLATRVRETFDGITHRMRMLGTILVQEDAPSDVRERFKTEFFSKERDLLAIYVHDGADSPAPSLKHRAIGPEMQSLGDPSGDKALAAVGAEKELALDRVGRGEALLGSIRLADGSPAIALSIPFISAPGGQDRFTHSLTAVIRQTRFAKAFAESDIITSYLVDHKGRLLAHPDASRVAAGESMAQIEVVRQMLGGKFNNGQTRYIDPVSGEPKLGAFTLVGFGALGVVSEVPEAKALEAAEGVKRNSIYLAGMILCIAFLVGFLYSGTITRPIQQLVAAAGRISRGDFAINLSPKSRDEVATLAFAFNDMAKGLEERDKVKATFAKFHNKEIADKLLSGEVKLGGERKEATIFFSDVRGFTAMSESMEPEQVVEMLNEYMTRMVSIIRAHNGVVDKYVGDAIMAIWGVPLQGEDDAGNAVKACLAMREELARLNALRLSRGQNALKIGMGLNTGSVIAGNIGSDEKMEYTVIGDSVNLASRMESMTKEYGTDLLVPKVIADRLAGRFIFRQEKSAKVKGKSQAIEIFTVQGRIDADGRPVLVETPYSSYESERSDKVVHEPEPAPLMAEGWYVRLGTDILGPFSEQEIQDGMEDGEFTPDTEVAAAADGPWDRISERRELAIPMAEPALPEAGHSECAAPLSPATPPPFNSVAPPPFNVVTPPPFAMTEPPPVLEPPMPVLEVPTAVLEAPTAVLEAPTAVLEVPTTVLEAPTAVLEVPTTVLEAPTAVLEAPTAAQPIEASPPPPLAPAVLSSFEVVTTQPRATARTTGSGRVPGSQSPTKRPGRRRRTGRTAVPTAPDPGSSVTETATAIVTDIESVETTKLAS